MKPVIRAAIDAERERQEQLWNRPHLWGYGSCASDQVSDAVKAVVLGGGCGEVSRAVLERDRTQLYRELVQVAAVAVAWLECLSGPSTQATLFEPDCSIETIRVRESLL